MPMLPIEDLKPEGAPVKKVKILIVDDSKTIRRTAEILLTKAGFNVSAAQDGFEALSRIDTLRPDFAFLDVLMPRLDGYQTCVLLRHNPEFQNMPVCMLSGQDGLVDRVRARIVGANGYITKPFTREALLRAIGGWGAN